MAECKNCEIHCVIYEEEFCFQSPNDSQLESRVADLNEQCDKLQADHSNLQTDHSALQSDHSALKNQFFNLQSDHSALQSDHSALKNQFFNLQSHLQSEKQKKMLIRKLQEYYRIYLTIKYPNEFEKYYNELTKIRKKKYIIKYEQFFQYLPKNFATEGVDNIDFEYLIMNNQYWENCIAAHTIIETQEQSEHILGSTNDEVMELLKFIYRHKSTIEQQKLYLSQQRNIN
jgi:FtsZ-binding cell division protein ZapB